MPPTGTSEAVLSRMRKANESMLPDECAILDSTETPDGAGGTTVTVLEVYRGPCRLDPIGLAGADVKAIAMRESITVLFILTVLWDAPIAADRQVVHPVTGPDQHTYEIVTLMDDMSNRVYRQAHIVRID